MKTTTLISKEDMGLSHDVEVVDTTTVNMFDSPMEVLQACFPNEKAPKIRLHDIYITYAKTYIDKPHKIGRAHV